MSHYKPYSAYKDSGVEWIGKVPEHWDVARIKRMAQIATARCNTIPAGLTYIGLEDVESGSGQYKPTATTSRQSDDSTVGLFQGGDVLYGKLRPYLRKCITGLVDGACSTEFLVIKPSSLSPAWLRNWLLTNEVTQQIEAGCDGAKMPRADWEHVGSIQIPAPDKVEQDAILTKLDRETARIDALIAKKTEFIELLAKKRQALITHAVTKGLNPKAKMKDSGVEWIGEVPEHWEVRRMATLFREAIRPGDPSLPILSISIHDGITDEEVAAEDRDRRVSQIEDRTKYKRVAPDDLAYNMMRAWQGAFGAVTVDGLVSPAYVVAEPTDEFRTGYIEHLLRTPSAIEEMRRYSRGIADFRMRLYWDYFRDLKVCLPRADEQDVILARIGTETRRIDMLTGKTQLSIDLLKKRRSALITAAVTGQIDLRESA
ncbi:MAG: restriction endonuclease subunit S [Anaerolineae bacterium]|nr:restriction endonuclease subunit S [Anaerolineae bacterium]